jgi:hypothetical protein
VVSPEDVFDKPDLRRPSHELLASIEIGVVPGGTESVVVAGFFLKKLNIGNRMRRDNEVKATMQSILPEWTP